jgi:D-3-phosphoglycerate dehydrogenase
MPKILYADNDYAEIDLERALFGQSGIEIVVAQCKTEEEVIEAGRGCRGILLQYAPFGAKVVTALPELGIV